MISRRYTPEETADRVFGENRKKFEHRPANCGCDPLTGVHCLEHAMDNIKQIVPPPLFEEQELSEPEPLYQPPKNLGRPKLKKRIK